MKYLATYYDLNEETNVYEIKHQIMDGDALRTYTHMFDCDALSERNTFKLISIVPCK